MAFNHLAEQLQERRQQQLYRQRRELKSAQGPVVELNRQRCVNFCSNDYLGLAAHPKLVQAMQNAAAEFGVGSGASHLVCGHSRIHHQLEEALAEQCGRPRALLFSTGYMANLAVIQTLVGKGDAVLEDKLNHASLIDAGLASGARFQRFVHNDMASLETRLHAQSAAANRLIVADGVFSMDGDLAPLPAAAALARQYDAWLMIDDAHGFGVLGENGGGCVEHFGLDIDEVPVLMATFGKALGGFGAFVAGSDDLIETLIQHARSYIYTTALPPAVAAANLAALGLLEREAWRRQHLQQLVRRFRQSAEALLSVCPRVQLMPSMTAIQPLLVGDSGRALALSEALQQRGYLVGAIRPPTVPAGTARLRITLSAAHSEEQVDGLLVALAEVLNEEGSHEEAVHEDAVRVDEVGP